jgi:hypothetical protein
MSPLRLLKRSTGDGHEMIVKGIKEEAGVAVVRLWFLAPGDICREC